MTITGSVAKPMNNLNIQAKEYFDSTLKRIDLDKTSIENQSLDELYASLERVNDALRNPDNYGVFEVNTRASLGIPLAGGDIGLTSKIGIGTFLLESKKLILNRIKSLESKQRKKSKNISSPLMEQQTNEKISNELKDRFDELEMKIQERTFSQQQIIEQAKLEAFNKELQLEDAKFKRELAKDKAQTQRELAKMEKTWQVWFSFIARESVATIVGAVLLVAIGVAQISTIFNSSLHVSDILNNAFLVLLGYFFGQTVGAMRSQIDVANINSSSQNKNK